VAVASAGLGIGILAGIFKLQIEPSARYIFGGVFILMAFYRLAVTRMKDKPPRTHRRYLDE
jgi:hypothetical protein